MATKTTTKTTTKPAKAPAKAPATVALASVKIPRTSDARESMVKDAKGQFAGLLREAMIGKFGIRVKEFYRRAMEHHAKKGTLFPRQQLGTVKIADAREQLTMHGQKQTVMDNAEGWQRRAFDAMMVESFQGGAK